MKRGFTRYTISFAFIVLFWFFASWLVGTILSGPESSVLPGPLSAFYTLFNHWGDIWPNFLRSGFRLVVALFVAVFLGSISGLIVGFESKIDKYVSPVLYLLYPIPKIVLLPVILIIFGLGDISRIIFIFLVTIFQVMISARDAAKNVSPTWVKAVKSSGGDKLQIYRHVVIPATLPSILSSVRISIGLGVAALYLAELSYTNQGLGYFIDNSWKVFAYSDVFAGILAFAALGLGLYLLIDLLERIFCKWSFEDRS
ncbi:ABC transporter permease [Candidatus Bipolaricaulota bacterium]|nr:ABC transporter permease [Candidatus Bipolaricaulota bacterium]